MAYMSQELKAKIVPTIKAVCKKYGVKASLAVRNHSVLVLNIKSSKIDFIGNYNKIAEERAAGQGDQFYPAKDNFQVNVYHVDALFTGKAKNFLNAVLAAMNEGNHDRSDSQFDYFVVGWYTDVEVGKLDQTIYS